VSVYIIEGKDKVTPHAATAQPNSYAERFAILRLLGCGAQGTVHLAFDRCLKRDVAIKRITRPVVGQGLAH
jgi:hypothetical protein